MPAYLVSVEHFTDVSTKQVGGSVCTLGDVVYVVIPGQVTILKWCWDFDHKNKNSQQTMFLYRTHRYLFSFVIIYTHMIHVQPVTSLLFSFTMLKIYISCHIFCCNEFNEAILT